LESGHKERDPRADVPVPVKNLCNSVPKARYGDWAQAQLRQAGTTMNIYTQEIPSSVKAAVEALDQKLCGVLNTIEHGLKM
jgi:hypothetical protein